MIDHNNHFSRFSTLMNSAAALSPARRRDFGYISAIYILSSDKELFAISQRKISPDGISFSRILSTARRAELSDTQRTAIKAAYSLFNGGCASITTHDLAQCDYSTLDIITAAIYIWKGGCAMRSGERGEILLDRDEERRRREFEQLMESAAQHALGLD